jgi:hypothetical protein
MDLARLDTIIERATSLDPSKRCTCAEIAKILREIAQS